MGLYNMSGLSLSRLLLISLSGAVLAGCSVAEPYTDNEQSIVDSLDSGLYQPASRTSRDNIETQSSLAKAAFWSREYQLNPSDLESAVKLSESVRKLGNAPRAAEIAQLARALHPRDPYLTAEFAAALIASDRGDEAVKPLQDGLRQTPQYARLWSLMGAALDQGEQYAQARKHYGRALSITPNEPSILANMGLSYALEGDAAQAETWLRRAAAIPGASTGIHQNLNLVLQLQGKTPSQAQTKSAQRPSGPKTSIKPARQIRQAANPHGAPAGYRNDMTFTKPASGRRMIAPSSGQQVGRTITAATAPQATNNYSYSNSPSISNNAPQNAYQQNNYPQNNYQNSSGAPMTAMDAARAAAARTQGRKVSVPQGSPPPQSSVLDTIAGQVGPRSATGIPARQALAGQARARQNTPSNTTYAPTQLPGYGPQGYNGQQPRPIQNRVYPPAPQAQAPTPRGAARRR